MGDAQPFADLLADIARARAVHQARQRQPGHHLEALASSRNDLLDALERYTDALEERGWPVPRGMQQDVRMLRSLCGRGPRPAG